MSAKNPIETDFYYKRIADLVYQSELDPVERVLFLSSFESWYYSQSYHLYSSICQKAICYFEGVKNA